MRRIGLDILYPMGNTTCDGHDDPDDFFIQILVWLPVISLLRFKSVCKSWRALIQSSSFIHRHTASSSSSKFGTFILQAFGYPTDNPYIEGNLFMLSSGSGGTGEDCLVFKLDDDDDQVFRLNEFGFPPCSQRSLLTRTILMVGSCNGLICLHDLHPRDVFLCNPATRQSRILPKWITIEEEDGVQYQILSDFIAFGFDVKTKDYKVVRITPFVLKNVLRGEGCMCRVQVYSLSTDSWRLLEGIHSLPALPRQGSYINHGIYMNGSYFFVGRKSNTISHSVVRSRSIPICIPRCNNCLIFSFDFTKEILITMQFPDHDERHNLVLTYLGEKMAVFTIRRSALQSMSYYRDCDGYEYCDIWVLNEHGSSGVNKESWTKLHSFRRKSNTPTLSQIRCISNNGELVLLLIKTDDGDELEFFNLVTKEANKDFKIGNGVLTADVYKQGLVSIIGGNDAAAAASQ